MKIAIIHDWLVTMRGGEKVLEALCEAYPSADLYTIYCDKNQISQKIRNMNIIPSFIQRLPFANRNFRLYLPLFPLAVEKFNLKSYDLIISVSHCVAKGIIPVNGAFHVCYCNAPMRYVWDFQDEYLGKLKSNLFTGKLIRALIKYLKNWDERTCPRVHAFIANSRNIAGKIKNTNAGIILMLIFAACSSARCLLLVRMLSAKTLKDCATLVPNRSVWIRTATKAFRSSTLVRLPRLRNASARFLPALTSRL